ncbi:CoA transferase [Streptomyces sp. INA 01156]
MSFRRAVESRWRRLSAVPPAYWRSAVADKVMGIYGAAAACAALRSRDVTGEGRAVEVPMFEAMAAFMLLDRQGGWVTDPPNGRPATPHRLAAPPALRHQRRLPRGDDLLRQAVALLLPAHRTYRPRRRPPLL